MSYDFRQALRDEAARLRAAAGADTDPSRQSLYLRAALYFEQACAYVVMGEQVEQQILERLQAK